jgi:hypothetical protein
MDEHVGKQKRQDFMYGTLLILNVGCENNAKSNYRT